MTKERIQGHIAIFFANVIFGIYIPMSKYLLHSYISGEALTLLRIWGATILFWIAGSFIKEGKMPLKDLGLLLFFSFTGVIFNQGLFVFGLKETSPIDASVIVTSAPLMVMVLSAIFMHDPITRRKAAGVMIGAAGALWLVLSSQHVASTSATPLGDSIVLVSALSSAIYFSLSKPLVSRHSPIVVSKWIFLFSSIIFMPLVPSWTTSPDAFRGDYDISVISMIAFVVVGATFLTYLLIAFAIKRMRPTTMAMYNYVQPFISSCAAIAIGQDIFSFEKVFATVLVFLGVYIVTTSSNKNQNLHVEAVESLETR